jgi:SP family arabinose:H+ symporter-like MFS transporter
MYIAEMSPHRMRGKLGTMYQLAIVVGSTVAPLIGYVLVDVFPPAVCWRWMFASQMVVVVVFALFLFLLPPSPRWLAQKGRQEEALAVLARVHGPEGAPIELRGINEAIAQETGGLAELMQPGIGIALLIGFLLAFFNNWTGWSAMGGYMTMLFEMAGVKERGTAILLFALTYLLMAILTVASMWLVDRVGRRPLWVIASILMGIFTALTGAVLQGQVHWAFLLMLFLCTVPHGLALGGLPWLMMSELFPNRIRAKAVAVTTTFLWLVIFTCAQFFPMIIDSSQRHLGSAAGAFWTCTLVCVCSTIFGLTIMPETRGRTLEEIGSSWRRR